MGINIACCPVLFLFAFNVSTDKRLWRWLFFMRIFTDLSGHSYEWKFIQSYFAQDPSMGLTVLGAFILPKIPSYIAHYQYAFKIK